MKLQIFLIFTLGEDKSIFTHIFQIGWFNHQPENHFDGNLRVPTLDRLQVREIMVQTTASAPVTMNTAVNQADFRFFLCFNIWQLVENCRLALQVKQTIKMIVPHVC